MPALPVRDHAGQERAHRAHHPHQVDIDDPVDVGIGHFDERIERSRAGVGEHQLHRAERRDRRIAQSPDRLAVADVAGERDGLASRSAHPCGDALGLVAHDVGHHHPRTLPAELARQPRADPAAAAGDDRRLARDCSHLAATGSIPFSVQRWNSRLLPSSNGMARCIAPVLSQIARSPSRHWWR